MKQLTAFVRKYPLLCILYSGIVIRILLIGVLPVVNDEGSYFYDAYMINQGYIPYKDFLTKSPPHIYMIATMTTILGNTITAGRSASLLLYVMSTVMLFKIADKLFDRQTAVIAALLLTFYAEIASLTTYAQTQPLLFFSILAMIYVHTFWRYSQWAALGVGLLFSFGYMTRMTAVVSIAYICAAVYMDAKAGLISYKNAFRYLMTMGLSAILILLLAYFIASETIGVRKALDFMGMEMLLQSAGGGQNVALGSILIAKIVGFFQNMMAVLTFFIKTPLIMFGASIFLMSFLPKRLRPPSLLVLTIFNLFFLYNTFSLLYGRWHEAFYYLPEYAVIFAASMFLIFRPKVFNDVKNPTLIPFLAWAFAALGLYGIWIKFRTPYFMEIAFPLIIIVAYVSTTIINQAKKQSIVWICLVFLVLSVVRSFFYFYTGTYKPQFVARILPIIERYVGPDDTVLTASLIFPFVAERKLPVMIPHPYWLGYADFDQDLRALYMPSLESVHRTLRQNPPQVVIIDKTTKETYFDQYAEALNLLEEYEGVYVDAESNFAILHYRGMK